MARSNSTGAPPPSKAGVGVAQQPGTSTAPADIWGDRTRWPVEAGRIFLPEAIETLGDMLWASNDVDLDPTRDALLDETGPVHERGILWDLGCLFLRLLVDGALTGFVKPVAGGRGVPLRSHGWDERKVRAAVQTGRVRAADALGVVSDNYVFLDENEFRLLLLIHSPAGGVPGDVLDNLRRRHDRMTDIIMANIPAIAATNRRLAGDRGGAGDALRRKGTNPTREELDRLFDDAPRVLEGRHQLQLIDMVKEWLLGRFAEDTGRDRYKVDLQPEAQAVFSPYLSEDLFRAAWREAVALAEERSKGGRPSGKGEDRRKRSQGAKVDRAR